jgi:hypothetical protein
MTPKYVDFNQIEAGALHSGSAIIGWARENTSEAGRRHVGFGVYHMEVILKLADGRRVPAIATSAGPR